MLCNPLRTSSARLHAIRRHFGNLTRAHSMSTSTEQKKPITLYTSSGSPNGYAASVALEELEIKYNLKIISFETKDQKSEWFLKINPNGRVPAIVDHNNKEGDFPVFETSAILLYLAQHYDPEHKISYDPIKEPNLFSEQVQWIMFAHGGIGPMQGQANHFYRFAAEKIPYAIKRYIDETNRLFSVLEQRLQDREWLVGPHYSITDIKTFTWVMMGPMAGVDMTLYPNIQAWLARIESRPKTDAGLGVPQRTNLEENLKHVEQMGAYARSLFGWDEKK